MLDLPVSFSPDCPGQVRWACRLPDWMHELGFWESAPVWCHLLPSLNDSLIRKRARVRAVDDATRVGIRQALSAHTPCASLSYGTLSGWAPYPYQEEGARRACASGTLLLADACGLGKTPTSMLWWRSLMAAGLVRGLVVFCPAYAGRQWRLELREKLAVPQDDIELIEGSPFRRATQYKKQALAYIVNYEKARSRDRFYLTGLCADRAVVLDEASDKVKNPSSDVSKCIRRVIYSSAYRMALSATPIENGLDDLWHIVHLLRPGWLGPRRWFKQRYVRERQIRILDKQGRPRMWTKVEGFRRLREVRALLAPVYLRRMSTDPEVAAYLPKVSPPKFIDVVLSKDHAKAYQQVEAQTYRNKLEKNIRLVQAAQHPGLLGYRGESSKTKILIQLLRTELRNEKVLVFTFFEQLVGLLMHELRSFRPRKITGRESPREREFARRALQEGDCRLLFLTAAGQRALNLQAARIVVNFDLPWNPAAIKQRVGRVRRAASEHDTVVVYNLVAKGTIEETSILPRIASKQALFEQVLGEDTDVVGRDSRVEWNFSD